MTPHVPWAVQATLSGNTVTITNPQFNVGLGFAYGDQGVITSVDLNGPGGYTGDGGAGGNGEVANGSFTANKPFTVHSPSPVGTCNIVDPINVQCFFARYGARDANIGIHPGESATITYPSNMPGTLDSVSVNYDFADIFPRCRPSGFGSDLRFRPTFTAGAAAADCLAPTNVRITAMHINTKQRTASFRQTAQHATGFGCRLERNNTVMFSHSCGARKVYASPLPRGTYIYEVWGINKSGVSRDFAVARFKFR